MTESRFQRFISDYSSVLFVTKFEIESIFGESLRLCDSDSRGESRRPRLSLALLRIPIKLIANTNFDCLLTLNHIEYKHCIILGYYSCLNIYLWRKILNSYENAIHK